MKKLLSVAAGMGITVCLIAQPSNVQTAYRFLKEYEKGNDPASLVTAKQRIDSASVNEKTKAEAKTWNYRGQVYQMIFESNLKTELEKLKTETDNNKKILGAYQNTALAELIGAVDFYKKAKELDVKKVYSEELDKQLKRCSQHFENAGIANYNSRKYAEAIPAFENIVEISALFGKTDTSNLNNAALVSEKAKIYDKAIQYYNRLIELKYGNGLTYSRLADVKLAQKDSAAALEIVKKGRAAYPEDANLLITETNFFLAANKQTQALENLKLAIQKEPNNANLYLVAGNVLDNIANPKDAKGHELDKPKNYTEMITKAEEYYKKAVELKADYFDALYNLGILYNNKGVFLAQKADKITDQTKYAGEAKKAEAEFARAIPLLEKAHAINPGDRNTMFALKQLYARTEQKEKLNQMTEKLKN